jgi:F-type H+-transporting ATPase subunit delta
MNGMLAKRYARALAGVATEDKRLEQTAEELERVATWLKDPELAAALASPTLGTEARTSLTARVIESLGLTPLTRRFVALLAERNRLGELPGIVRAYVRLVDEALGRVRAIIRVAMPLSPAQSAKLTSAVQKIVGKTVLAQVEVQPELIAGVTVEIEGRVYDGSVRTQLAHLAQSMAREGAGG